MKKLLFRVLLLALLLVPLPTMAEVRLGISIFMPPLIVFDQPPELIVLPETYVYVVPDIIDEEIFFYDGWWWRRWEGNWYRSRDYSSSSWDSYIDEPSFYSNIPLNWRNDYKEYNWKGHQWIHQRISYKEVEQNWNVWEQNGYWEKHSWDVKGLDLTRMKWKSDSGIIISAPLPIIFTSPPQLVVVPETNIYVVPGVAADIFFYSGWWWRPSKGSWYRSRRYYSGWVDYPSVPSFYRDIPADWRDNYRAERWRGSQWNPQLIPHEQVQESWSRWEKTNYWENERTWGVENMESVRRLKHPSTNAQQGTQLRQESIDVQTRTRSQQQSIDVQQQQSIDAQQQQSIDAQQQQSRQQVKKVKTEQLHQKQTERKSQKVKTEQLEQTKSNNKQHGNNKQHQNNGNNKKHENSGKNK